jgi:hypothetical protein
MDTIAMLTGESFEEMEVPHADWPRLLLALRALSGEEDLPPAYDEQDAIPPPFAAAAATAR